MGEEQTELWKQPVQKKPRAKTPARDLAADAPDFEAELMHRICMDGFCLMRIHAFKNAVIAVVDDEGPAPRAAARYPVYSIRELELIGQRLPERDNWTREMVLELKKLTHAVITKIETKNQKKGGTK